MPHQAHLIDTNFIYQNSPCGYLLLDPSGNITRINQTLLNWLHKTNDEVVNTLNLSALLTRGGRLYYDMVVYPTLTLQGHINEISFDIQTAAGVLPCLFSAVAVKNDDGDIIAINAILFNITDRKRYEALLLQAKRLAEEEKKRVEFLADRSPNIMWVTNHAGEIDFVNQRFHDTFGHSDTPVRFSFFRSNIDPEQQALLDQSWQQALAHTTNFEVEVRLRTATGTLEWFLIQAVPYHETDGYVSAWFGSCTNINERKSKEQQTVSQLHDSLSKASAEITRNTQTLREIAFNQSHLVRHPLANILSLIDIMVSEPDGTDMQPLLAMLKDSAEKLDQVIQDIVFKTTY